MSVAGGVSKAVERALVHGCESLQIFSKNANRWLGSPLDPAEVTRFRRAHRRDRHHAGRIARQLPDQSGDDVRRPAPAVDRGVCRRARSCGGARPARRGDSSGDCTAGTEDDGLRLIADAIRAGVQGAAAPKDDGAPRAHGRPGPYPRPPLRAPCGDHPAPQGFSTRSASASTPATSSPPATTSSARRDIARRSTPSSASSGSTG